MLKIYHNPRCSKSRAALSYMQDNAGEFSVVEYLTETLSPEKLKELLEKLNYKPSQLARKGEEQYKLNNLKEASEEEIFAALLEYPKLIERPIIEGDKEAVIARPLDNLVEFLAKK